MVNYPVSILEFKSYFFDLVKTLEKKNRQKLIEKVSINDKKKTNDD